ncbi:uncharacterized protein A4U43_C06F4600 [Asparagus officinalis]|uniref:Uncharacterized protein n=1 Tax=Asparagus officinalis TaxID=4686 RepID=A0A5P1EJJ4_ASPOF|nr:uncharacterized protein A4U43_C06F4600 [Asparagus officinalis]
MLTPPKFSSSNKSSLPSLSSPLSSNPFIISSTALRRLRLLSSAAASSPSNTAFSPHGRQSSPTITPTGENLTDLAGLLEPRVDGVLLSSDAGVRTTRRRADRGEGEAAARLRRRDRRSSVSCLVRRREERVEAIRRAFGPEQHRQTSTFGSQ